MTESSPTKVHKSDATPKVNKMQRRAKSGYALFLSMWKEQFNDLDAAKRAYPDIHEDKLSTFKSKVWRSLDDTIKNKFNNIAASEKPPLKPLKKDHDEKPSTKKYQTWLEKGLIDEDAKEINSPYKELRAIISG